MKCSSHPFKIFYKQPKRIQNRCSNLYTLGFYVSRLLVLVFVWSHSDKICLNRVLKLLRAIISFGKSNKILSLESISLGQKSCWQDLGTIHSHLRRCWEEVACKIPTFGTIQGFYLRTIFLITLADVSISLFGLWALGCGM